VGRGGPSDAHALVALPRMVEEGTKLIAVLLPPGVFMAKEKVRKCDSAVPQTGYRWGVPMLTADRPLVGELL